MIQQRRGIARRVEVLRIGEDGGSRVSARVTREGKLWGSWTGGKWGIRGNGGGGGDPWTGRGCRQGLMEGRRRWRGGNWRFVEGMNGRDGGAAIRRRRRQEGDTMIYSDQGKGRRRSRRRARRRHVVVRRRWRRRRRRL